MDDLDEINDQELFDIQDANVKYERSKDLKKVIAERRLGIMEAAGELQ